jgi:hypothetical protein
MAVRTVQKRAKEEEMPSLGLMELIAQKLYWMLIILLLLLL